jgi:predicted acylesterase/phospholipase RssA
VSDKYSGYKEFRVMYIGDTSLIESLKIDFIKAGARNTLPLKPNSFSVSSYLIRRLALAANSFPGATINFYTDVHELARELPVFDADLIILDERIMQDESQINQRDENEVTEEEKIEELQHADVLHTSQSFSEQKEQQIAVNFENLRSAIEKFTPRGFIYTMRRVVVVLPKSARKTNREFYLSLSNVRAVITDPPDSVELFLAATRQLYDFRQNHKKTSICISGGGLEGYIYSIGVVSALDSCLLDKETGDFDIFCGVSSGAIIASTLAVGVHSDDLVRQIYRKHTSLEPLGLNTVFDLAGSEIARRAFDFVRAFSTFDSGELISRLQHSVPTGFFKGEKLKKFFEKQLRHFGIDDNMATLKKELYINVTDQDTGENIVFGEEPWKDIKISQAIRASTALPPFYLPELVKGHWFTDGQLTSASDFNTAIRKGSALVVYVDPMVPYTSNLPGAVMKKGGYFTMVQAVKSLVQTRSSSMLKHSMDNNPDVDFVIFKPTDEVMEAMAGNPMKYYIRTELVDLGFRCTISQILSSYDAIAHKFAKHGFALKSKNMISSLLN